MTDNERNEMKDLINETLNERQDKTAQDKAKRDEIMKISDASERQKAIAENHELFGF